MSKSEEGFRIALIGGDGIGPEVVAEALKVLMAAGLKLEVTEFDLGAERFLRDGEILGNETLEKLRLHDAILFGAIGHPKYDNDPTAKVRPEQGLLKLRKSLQLFANIRPINTFPSLHHLSPLKKDRLEGVDCVIFRELTGGIYFGTKELSEDQQDEVLKCVEALESDDDVQNVYHNLA